jgi:ribosomal protein L40E
VTCLKCRTENAPGAKFCVECGKSLKSQCPKCGLANPAHAKFCQECGTSFGGVAEAKKPVGDGTRDIRVSSPRPVGEIPDGERKTVTALFADIKGSMELIEDLDPEEAQAVIAGTQADDGCGPSLRWLRGAIHR